MPLPMLPSPMNDLQLLMTLHLILWRAGLGEAWHPSSVPSLSAARRQYRVYVRYGSHHVRVMSVIPLKADIISAVCTRHERDQLRAICLRLRDYQPQPVGIRQSLDEALGECCEGATLSDEALELR